jgi:hypothetical protein
MRRSRAIGGLLRWRTSAGPHCACEILPQGTDRKGDHRTATAGKGRDGGPEGRTAIVGAVVCVVVFRSGLDLF